MRLYPRTVCSPPRRSPEVSPGVQSLQCCQGFGQQRKSVPDTSAHPQCSDEVDEGSRVWEGVSVSDDSGSRCSFLVGHRDFLAGHRERVGSKWVDTTSGDPGSAPLMPLFLVLSHSCAHQIRTLVRPSCPSGFPATGAAGTGLPARRRCAVREEDRPRAPRDVGEEEGHQVGGKGEAGGVPAASRPDFIVGGLEERDAAEQSAAGSSAKVPLYLGTLVSLVQ